MYRKNRVADLSAGPGAYLDAEAAALVASNKGSDERPGVAPRPDYSNANLGTVGGADDEDESDGDVPSDPTIKRESAHLNDHHLGRPADEALRQRQLAAQMDGHVGGDGVRSPYLYPGAHEPGGLTKYEMEAAMGQGYGGYGGEVMGVGGKRAEEEALARKRGRPRKGSFEESELNTGRVLDSDDDGGEDEWDDSAEEDAEAAAAEAMEEARLGFARANARELKESRSTR